ncbi:hypothetical protein GGI19_000933 [Coemansia pectinata]|uniref:CHY-type domain-containing protein n=1 Tax=Coemansia pectinata TaxID=1052879 RepID=A0A9W8LBQ6_9FUNG|nr:hypothetical protein GGI19_000933 [Coemansia pectinata]
MAITVDSEGPANTIAGGHVLPTNQVAAGDTSAQAVATNSGRPPRRQTPRRPVVCRFFQQGNSCRAGDTCTFLHIANASTAGSETTPGGGGRSEATGGATEQRGGGRGGRGRGRGRGGQDKGTQRGGSIRKTQIDDLLKVPKWVVKRLSSERGESAFAVEMRPSDPDFPFDLTCLYMALVVPASYPTKRISDPILEIQIANKSIPTGVKRNIEVGFAKHVRKTAHAAIESDKPEEVPSLEEYVSWLDHNLELLMQQKPAPTIKFATFSGPSKSNTIAEPTVSAEADSQRSSEASQLPNRASVPSPSIPRAHTALRPPVPRPVPELASSVLSPVSPSVGTDGTEDPRRISELRQLERRFRGNYTVISDTPSGGTAVKLDIAPTDPDIQPLDITQITSTITVARSYPDSPSANFGDGLPRLPAVTLALESDSILGRKGKPSSWQPVGGRQKYLDFVCRRFGEHVLESPGPTLLHHLNWLDRWLVSMISTPPPEQQTPVPPAQARKPVPTTQTAEPVSRSQKQPHLYDESSSAKPWVKTISVDEAGLAAGMAKLGLAANDSESDTDSLSDSDISQDDEHHAEDADNVGELSKPARRGTEIRLAETQLTNISLTHCSQLNLTVRCGRCKGAVELRGILPTTRTGKDNQLWKACDSCSTILGVRFRPDWMFVGSTTMGYLDCSGCAPTDLLPSKFSLSCEACGMADDNDDVVKPPADTVVTVSIGSTTALNCRSCYAKMSMILQAPQFVRLMDGIALGGSASAAQISSEVERTRKSKVNKREELARLGVVPGQPLPDHGACKHFRKSTRWLRFPCCSKTFPCVTCHDEKEDHEHEYAQIMLCGHCSKEQRISKAENSGLCVSCGAQVIKKVDGNHAFWQGGTGVRDRTRMSRKDTRKFQGLGKTVAVKNVTTPKKQN